MTTMSSPESTSDDRLWGALSYLPFFGWIIAIAMLLMEDKKSRPFIKFSAVQALVLDVVLVLLYLLLSFVSFGILGLCLWIIFLLPLWAAYQAYTGKLTQVPVISNLIRNQGWA